MNPIYRTRHVVGVLAASACVLLVLAAGSPAMAATARVPHYGPPVGGTPLQGVARVHTVLGGGMPGWQIVLIAVGSAILAAVLAVTTDRAWTARRTMTAPSF